MFRLFSFVCLFIHLLLPSFNPFSSIGFDTPPWAQWLLDNKIYACMMTFFLFNGRNDILMIFWKSF